MRVRPELGELLYEREVLLWVDRLEKMGFTLVSKPSPPRLTPCADPNEPPGSVWAVVRAKFFHRGPTEILRSDEWEAMQAEKRRVGAKKDTKGAGVARWLEGMSPEDAAAAVQAAKPRKETE